MTETGTAPRTELTLARELQSMLNRHCRENESNTPDFILAEYLMDALKAFEKASNARTKWYLPEVPTETGLTAPARDVFIICGFCGKIKNSPDCQRAHP